MTLSAPKRRRDLISGGSKMLITVLEWAAFFLYVLIFIAALVGEVKWLTRKGWATSGKAVGYVMTSDLLGVGIGSARRFNDLFSLCS